MPDNKKPLPKEEIERRKKIQEERRLKRQRKITSGAGAGKRKVRTKVPTSTYVPVEKKANEITPRGVVQPSPFGKLGQRDADSPTTFREEATNPIMKHCGGK